MTLDKSAANSADVHCLLLNCCFMMNLLPSNHQANFPVSRVEQNFMGTNPERQYVRAHEIHAAASTGVRRIPVRKIPPVLAGIRAGKFKNLTFPCD
jgi:hypothetical protein